jgi:hypothetical protein
MATRTEIQPELERAVAELEADAGSLTTEQLERRCAESEVPGAAGHRSLPRKDLRELAAMCISLDRAATAHQTEGVDAFARPYEEFLSCRRLTASRGAAGQDPG